MATRPVFLAGVDTGPLVRTVIVNFDWVAGMSTSQKRKCIQSLHLAAKESTGTSRFLEISTKSENPIGIALSAFNLPLFGENLPQTLSVECAYQGSKIFERGGPYTDLYKCSSYDAKSDPRLRSSGTLKGFRFQGREWGLDPMTAFYDWLYIQALAACKWHEEVTSFDGFTDIEFNPSRSVNSQAYAAALYVCLRRRSLLAQALASPESYLETISALPVNNVKRDDGLQGHFDW